MLLEDKSVTNSEIINQVVYGVRSTPEYSVMHFYVLSCDSTAQGLSFADLALSYVRVVVMPPKNGTPYCVYCVWPVNSC
jgi:hypothetical protein